MLIIEIHVDNTTDENPSTRAKPEQEDGQAATQQSSGLFARVISSLMAWFSNQEKNGIAP